jgi:hypothetical protein
MDPAHQGLHLRELLTILVQQAPENAIAYDEFLRDLILGDAFVRRAD